MTLGNSENPLDRPELRQRLSVAAAITVCLGSALLCWGFATVAVRVLVSGGAGNVSSLAPNVFLIALAVICFAMFGPMNRGSTFALWSSFAIGVLYFGAGFITTVFSDTSLTAIGLTFFGGLNSLTAWLAIDLRSRIVAEICRARARKRTIEQPLT